MKLNNIYTLRFGLKVAFLYVFNAYLLKINKTEGQAPFFKDHLLKNVQKMFH